MCGIKLRGRFPSKELRERLGVADIALVLLQNRLRCYGHVLQKDDDDWVKKCMEYEVEGPRPRGRPKRTWREVVKEDCQARRKLNKEDAIDCNKWRKLLKDVRWSGWVWVRGCFFWYRPTRVVSDQRPLNGCVCVCVRVRACVRVCVATYARCDEIFNIRLTANLSRNLAVNIFLNRLRFDRSMMVSLWSCFFSPTLYMSVA